MSRKQLLIASHCAAFALAFLALFAYERRMQAQVRIDDMFSGRVPSIVRSVTYAWGTRDDAKAAIREYLDHPRELFFKEEGVARQREIFLLESHLAVLGDDPHAEIANLCKKIDNSCKAETIDCLIGRLRKERKVPN
ncbi:MAG TPA: hypothetical protein VL137_04845 [Polyangiaceae bacterium]|jgi:hypothetical protein|nr:hypothetical protein [Polyangiaceae bacterium]